MELKELKKTQIITKDGHFIPLVFMGAEIPTIAVMLGGATLSKQVGKTIEDNKNKFSKLSTTIKGLFTPITNEPQTLSVLGTSTDDVKY